MANMRKWKIFVAPSCHVDVGYNFLPKQALENHEKNVSKAMETCNENPSFRWNLESAWIAQKYLENNPRKKENLYNLSREGKLGIQSTYLNMLTGVMSHEEMNRLCYFAGSLKRKHKIPMQSGMLTDVPSAIWSLPTVLALSGVKYFAHGVNPIYGRGPFYPRTNVKPLFWWQGPDGSQVLTWLAGGYGEANELLGVMEGCKRLEQTLPKFLSGYEQLDYPFDAVLVYGAHYENEIIDPGFSRVIEEWNATHEYPKLILSTPDEFFKYIEHDFGDKIPTYAGDEGCWWEDGVASSARETLLIRLAHGGVVTAEKIWSILNLIDPSIQYPSKKLGDIWENIFLYDEHTWGANKSITDPELDFVQKQWKVKSSYAHDAVKDTDSLVSMGFSILASRIGEGERTVLLVFNQLSWVRTDIVVAELDEVKNGFDLVDEDTKESVPYQRVGQKRICFVAKDVPSLGFKKYEVHYGEEPAASKVSVNFFPNGMENEFYRIEFSPETGAITSLYDKELDYELVDKQSRYGLNQYVYARGGKGTLALECNDALAKLKEMSPELVEQLINMISLPKFTDKLPPPNFEFFSPSSSKIQSGGNGPVFGEIKVKTRCEKTPEITQRVILYKNIKRVDLINEYDKEETYEKEGVYFAFPFRLSAPEFKIEIPNGMLQPEKDQMPGSCRDWYCVQHQVTISDRDRTVVWASPDTPLVSVQDINIGKWLEKLEIKNGSLFSYVMNNYWYTNYKASQKGCRVRYSITTCGGSIENSGAIHSGWSYANQLLAIFMSPNKEEKKKRVKERTKNIERSFFSVNKSNLVITAIKHSEDEKGFIVRLFETDGKKGEAVLQFPFKFSSAYLCNLIEEEIHPLPIDGNNVRISFLENKIITVKLVK
jgi:hypothetical protein